MDFLGNRTQSTSNLDYRVKVRRTTYLWGGEGVKQTLKADINSCLYFRVDEVGESVRFGVRSADKGALVEYGVLRPGECFTVPLKGVLGVYAQLDDPQDTYVDCSIFAIRD